MNNLKKTVLTLFIWLSSFTFIYADDHSSVNASVIIPKEEVDATLLEGLSRIAGDRSISDIVVRHIDVGEEYLKETAPHFSQGLVLDNFTSPSSIQENLALRVLSD